MSVVLTINKTGLANYASSSRSRRSKKTTYMSRNFLGMKKNSTALRKNSGQKSPATGFKKAGLVLAIAIILSGVFYLYQVNDLATKGYEMKEAENRIARLKEANEKNKIQELEFRSMYNIEKATESLNLVSSNNVSYLEIDGPVAMK